MPKWVWERTCRFCGVDLCEANQHPYDARHNVRSCAKCRHLMPAKKTLPRADSYIPLRLRLMRMISGGPPKCARCGNEDVRVLQIDHIHGDGSLVGRTLSIGRLERIIADGEPIPLQLLCANCHVIKTVENGEHKNWFLRPISAST